ncbi:MAG: alkaline shock response membrane anchor protein AmaP [Nitrospirota bacterium]|nr:alkaline shock response membrane anchor protein AmaP [Nitrospirota bacterium]
MNIINRVLIIAFIVATMAGAGVATLVLLELMSPETILADPWHLLLDPFTQLDSATWSATLAICLGVLSIGLLLLVIEFRSSWGPPKGFLLSRGPLGRVMIARRGVEELVAREAQGVDGVLEARAQVKQKRTGFHVIGQVSVSPTTNLPELTKEVQQRVKAAVTRHLGAQVSEVCIQTQLSPLSTRRQAVRRVR